MATNYQRGYALERRVEARLAHDGYYTATARGSRGAADVLAAKTGQLLLVQVKRKNPMLLPAERGALLDAAARAGGLAIVAYMPGRTGIAFRRLTGPGPKQWEPWTPDELGAA
jgi:Holliday junction resolvase